MQGVFDFWFLLTGEVGLFFGSFIVGCLALAVMVVSFAQATDNLGFKKRLFYKGFTLEFY